MDVKILVADDSTKWSAPFCEFLRRMGYSAHAVATGNGLEDVIKNHPDDYDILIVDNSMPEAPDEPELPYCGVRTLGSLVMHYRSRNMWPTILKRVIVRSIYSRADVDVLRNKEDLQTKTGCDHVREWFDRSAPLDDLMGAIDRLSRE